MSWKIATEREEKSSDGVDDVDDVDVDRRQLENDSAGKETVKVPFSTFLSAQGKHRSFLFDLSTTTGQENDSKRHSRGRSLLSRRSCRPPLVLLSGVSFSFASLATLAQEYLRAAATSHREAALQREHAPGRASEKMRGKRIEKMKKHCRRPSSSQKRKREGAFLSS